MNWVYVIVGRVYDSFLVVIDDFNVGGFDVFDVVLYEVKLELVVDVDVVLVVLVVVK